MALIRCLRNKIEERISEALHIYPTNTGAYKPIDYTNDYISIDYNKDWRIAVRAMLTSFNNKNWCIFGTYQYNQYYKNPTIEINKDTASAYYAVSGNGTSWTDGASAFPTENFALNTWYDFFLVYHKTSKVLSFVVKKVSDGSVIVNSTKTVESSSIFQPDFSTSPLCFFNNAASTYFSDISYVRFDPAYSFIENDEAVIWGNKY